MVEFNKKHILVAILPAIAISAIAIVLLTSESAKTEAVQPQSIPSQIGGALAKTRFANGELTDYIVETISPNNISLHRGESTTVYINLEHKTNGNGHAVTLTNFHNTVRNFGPSARANISDEQFEDAVGNSPNALIRGEVPTQGILTITPDSVRIEPDSNATLTMHVSLPKNIPDEMVGKSIYLTANYDINPLDSQTTGKIDTLVIEVLE